MTSSQEAKKVFRPQLSRRSSDPAEPVFQEDGPLVGTPDILSSPNVIEPDVSIRGLNNKPIPTPSIYRDARGEIINLLVGDDMNNNYSDHNNSGETTSETSQQNGTSSHRTIKSGKRINLLRTTKGSMRSGDLHPNTQCSFVFEGSIEVWIPQSDGTTKKFTLGPRDYFEVPAYVPHVESFLEDTVHAEWWEANDVTGANGFRHWFYAPYRRLVDLSFEWGHGDQPRGTLKLLREGKLIEDPVLEDETVKCDDCMTKPSQLTMAVGAIAMCGLGFFMGRMQPTGRS